MHRSIGNTGKNVPNPVAEFVQLHRRRHARSGQHGSAESSSEGRTETQGIREAIFHSPSLPSTNPAGKRRSTRIGGFNQSMQQPVDIVRLVFQNPASCVAARLAFLPLH